MDALILGNAVSDQNYFRLKQAQSAFAERRYEDARESFEEVLQERKTVAAAARIDWLSSAKSMAETFKFLALVSLAEGKPTQASAELSEGLDSLEHTTGDLKWSYALEAADLLRAGGDYQSAVELIRNTEESFSAEYRRIREFVQEGGKLDELGVHRWKNALQHDARGCCIRAEIYSDLDQLNETERRAELATRLAESAGDNGTVIEAKTLISGVRRRQGRLDAAAEYLQAVILAFEQVSEVDLEDGSIRRIVYGLDTLAHIDMAQGLPSNSVAYAKRAIPLSRRLSDRPVPEGIVRGTLGKVYYRLGKTKQANAELVRSLLLAHGRHPRCESYSYRVLGDLLVSANAPAQAKDKYQDAVRVATAIRNAHCLAMANVGLGRWEIMFGEVEAAATAFADVADHEDEGLRAEALSGLALARALGGYSDFRSFMDQAFEKLNSRQADMYSLGWIEAFNSMIFLFEGRQDLADLAKQRAESNFQLAAPVLIHEYKRLWLRYYSGLRV